MSIKTLGFKEVKLLVLRPAWFPVAEQTSHLVAAEGFDSFRSEALSGAQGGFS